MGPHCNMRQLQLLATTGVAGFFVLIWGLNQSFSLEMVSISSSSVSANGYCHAGQVSEDGRFAVFSSVASNLVANDTNGRPDVFLRDTVKNKTIRISVAGNGSQGDHQSTHPSISSDGNTIVFESQATNLVPNDTNRVGDIFAYDRPTGRISRVNLSSTGKQALGGNSCDPTISRDGRFVGFFSGATNLVPNDNNGFQDSFVRDLRQKTTVMVHRSSTGQQGNVGSNTPHVSAYGRYVVFSSDSTNLVAKDTNGRHDVFRRDLRTGTTERVSVSANGVEGNGHSTLPGAGRNAISDDGRYVAFMSRSTNLVVGDTNGQVDQFVKDMATEAIERVNVNDRGGQGRGGRTNWDPASQLSGDGRFVVFYALDSNLVAQDWNGTWDVFLRDRFLKRTTLLSRNSSGQQGNGRSFEACISRNGPSWDVHERLFEPVQDRISRNSGVRV